MPRRPPARLAVRRTPPPRPPSLLDPYLDLTDTLTALQRRTLAQLLADSYYERADPRLPSKAQVAEFIGNLQQSRPRGHNHT